MEPLLPLAKTQRPDDTTVLQYYSTTVTATTSRMCTIDAMAIHSGEGSTCLVDIGLQFEGDDVDAGLLSCADRVTSTSDGIRVTVDPKDADYAEDGSMHAFVHVCLAARHCVSRPVVLGTLRSILGDLVRGAWYAAVDGPHDEEVEELLVLFEASEQIGECIMPAP